MAEYTPPPKSNIPFSFSTGGYTPPDFKEISFRFDVKQIQSAMANLSAAVQVFDTRYETYSYLKYCNRYIIGYTSQGVQIIEERCYYGGIRDIGGFVRGTFAATKDLIAYIEGKIRGADLPAYIGVHPYYVLPAYIRGFLVLGFPAKITGVITADLFGYLNTIPPVNLPAYIKPRLVVNLRGTVHGWQIADLGSYVDIIFKSDLRAVIGVIEDIEYLPALIRGWVRAAQRNLSVSVRGYQEEYLGAAIIGAEYRDLGARLVDVQPKFLSAAIHGWQADDLQGLIQGSVYPWDLPAAILGRGAYENLGGSIKSMADTRVYRNLPAYLKVLRFKQDFPAEVRAYAIKDLSAFLNSGKGRSDLHGKIYPKMIRLTAILSIATMEKRDLVGVINASCRQSRIAEIAAYIRPVYLKDLTSYIRANIIAFGDLGASINVPYEYVALDILPIDVYVKRGGFRVEDKFIIYVNTYRSWSSLGAAIKGEPRSVFLPATINCMRLEPYEFERWKTKERVYELEYGNAVNYKDIDIDFVSIISEYFYSSSGDVVTKAHINEQWRTRLSSFYSPADVDRYLTRLYKVKVLFDLKRFNSIDEAIRYALVYVTTGFKRDLPANISGVGDYKNLIARVLPKIKRSTKSNLRSYINAVFEQEDDFVVVNIGDSIYTIDI